MSASSPVYIRRQDLKSRWSCSEPTVTRTVRQPGFPTPVRPSPQLVLYRIDELEAWELAQRGSPRNAA